MKNLIRIFFVFFILNITYESCFSQNKKVVKEGGIPRKQFKNWLLSNVNVFFKSNENVSEVSLTKTFDVEGLVRREIKINGDSSAISIIENYEFETFNRKTNKLPKEGDTFFDLLKEFDEMPNQKYGLKIGILNYCSESEIARLEKECYSKINEAEINIENGKEIRKYFFNRGTLVRKQVLQFISKGKNFKSSMIETSFDFIFKNNKLEKNITSTKITYLNPSNNIVKSLSD